MTEPSQLPVISETTLTSEARRTADRLERRRRSSTLRRTSRFAFWGAEAFFVLWFLRATVTFTRPLPVLSWHLLTVALTLLVLGVATRVLSRSAGRGSTAKRLGPKQH